MGQTNSRRTHMVASQRHTLPLTLSLAIYPPLQQQLPRQKLPRRPSMHRQRMKPPHCLPSPSSFHPPPPRRRPSFPIPTKAEMCTRMGRPLIMRPSTNVRPLANTRAPSAPPAPTATTRTTSTTIRCNGFRRLLVHPCERILPLDHHPAWQPTIGTYPDKRRRLPPHREGETMHIVSYGWDVPSEEEAIPPPPAPLGSS